MLPPRGMRLLIPLGLMNIRALGPAWGGRPGSVPFVSDRPGAYGRLLLSVYVRWRTDWLRPVTRGGWRTGFPDRVRSSADVS